MKTKLKASEKDVKEKILQNLFIEATKDMGIKVEQSYHLNAKSIKSISFSDILYEGNQGISLKCKGNVLTIDKSGIHFKTANFDDNSTGSGVVAKEVEKALSEKPEYEKIRVVKVDVDKPKQQTMFDEITFSAKVQKLENGRWNDCDELDDAELQKLEWNITKNSEENDPTCFEHIQTTDDVQKNKL